MKNIQQIKPKIIFLFIAIGIMLLSNLPYWAGLHAQTNNLLFKGSFFDESDYSVHISMMQAGQMGDWAYQMRFTSEEHQAAFIRMFYIFLGHISKLLNMGVETTFQASRLIFGFFALLSIYKLCLNIFPSQKSALLALLLSALGAGLGWLQIIFGAPLKPISPIDFWLIDAYVFFSISLFPAFSFTLMLMTTSLRLYFEFLDKPNNRYIFLICLYALVIQMINPIAFAVIDLAFIGSTVSYWWTIKKAQKSQILALTFIAIVQIPLLVYNFLILSHDPIWHQFTQQNETLSPPVKFYFWGFLPLLLFAIWGVIKSIQNRDSKFMGVATWAISGFLLAYLPVLIQRRFLLGITIPLGILAIYGLVDLVRKFSVKLPFITKRKDQIYLGYIILASASSISLALGLSLNLQTHPQDKFYPVDIENALVWLDKNAKPNEFVLGAAQTSQLTAQRTRLKAYAGHPMETLNYEVKESLVKNYYLDPEESPWLPERTPIQWVIYGPYEKEIASSFRPGSNLLLAYQNKTVQIYKVNK